MSQVRILSPRPIKSIGCRRREATMSPRHKAVPTSKSQPDCAPIFAALGDEMRLRPIAALCVVGVMSVTRLTAGTDITRQAMTKHLDLLAATGLERAVESCAVGVSSGRSLERSRAGSHLALQIPGNSYIIRAHFRFGLLGTGTSA